MESFTNISLTSEIGEGSKRKATSVKLFTFETSKPFFLNKLTEADSLFSAAVKFSITAEVSPFKCATLLKGP